MMVSSSVAMVLLPSKLNCSDYQRGSWELINRRQQIRIGWFRIYQDYQYCLISLGSQLCFLTHSGLYEALYSSVNSVINYFSNEVIFFLYSRISICSILVLSGLTFFLSMVSKLALFMFNVLI